MTIPDGKCPRCGEVRPRDGHAGHTTESGGFCTVVDGAPFVFQNRKVAKQYLFAYHYGTMGPKGCA